MLGKLIKHELRHSARYTMAIYAAVIVISAVMGLSLLSSATWLGVMSCGALYLTGIIAVIVTLVSVIKNFYDTLFGRQGYLTLTLPVKCSSLLISKVIVSFIWIVASFALMALTMIMIFFYAKEKSSGYFSMMSEAISLSGILELLPSASTVVKLLTVAAIWAVITIFTYVSFVYFTVTVANTRAFQSHPKILGGLVFLGIFSLNNTVGNMLTAYLPLSFNLGNDTVYFAFQQMDKVQDALFSYGVGGTVFSGLLALGLLFLTGYILENKVNLK
ncbi:MAG: hypothetical protein E7543_08260 [Ruminococcaceae bacterium]|nr:hypothetical protein [Oscillospiraceae bacterium]